MNIIKMRAFPIAILVFSHFSLFAQPAKDLRYFEMKYPDESVVEVIRRQTLQIRMTDGKPEIYTEKYVETILLTDRVAPSANEKLYYSPDNQIVELEAYSLIPQGNKYKKIDVKEFSHSFDFSNYIFYDDSRVCSFIFPSLTKGSKTVYRVRQKIDNPFFIPPLYFTRNLAVEKSEITIEYDCSVEMLFDEMAINAERLKSDVREKGQTIIVKKELSNIPALKLEDHVKSYIRYFPRIIPRIARYRVPEQEHPVTVLATLDDLYQLYWSFLQRIERNDDSHLQTLADSIVRHCRTEFEKVSAIYYWVQHNIRYVAIADGDNGYIPADAALVCSKRYGDCKGMSNLMYEMMKKAGIRTHLTWVGTSHLPYRYREIASPIVDNHMILCYFDEEDNPWFLDATSEFQSIMSAPPGIQGKECLVGIDSVAYKILTIPYSNSLKKQQLKVNLTGATLNIHTQQYLTGTFNQSFAYANVHKTNEEKRRIFERMLASDGYAKSAVDKVEHSDPYAVDDTLKVTASYRLTDYAVVSGGMIYIKLFFNIPVNAFIDPVERLYEYETDECLEYVWTGQILVPEGYQVEHLPEKVDIQHPLFSCFASVTYQEGQNIMISARYTTSFSTLPRTDYEMWNEMNRKVTQFCNQSLVLKKM